MLFRACLSVVTVKIKLGMNQVFVSTTNLPNCCLLWVQVLDTMPVPKKLRSLNNSVHSRKGRCLPHKYVAKH